jgi:hypothetical protein
LKLVSSFEPNKVNKNTSVQLDGLWLQGCEFDGRKMIDINEASASRELISLPTCYLGWIGEQEPDPYSDGSTVSTPIYHTLDREKLLC